MLNGITYPPRVKPHFEVLSIAMKLYISASTQKIQNPGKRNARPKLHSPAQNISNDK